MGQSMRRFMLSVRWELPQVRSYEERSMGKGEDAKACAFMEVMLAGGERECYGVGMDANIVTACSRADQRRGAFAGKTAGREFRCCL